MPLGKCNRLQLLSEDIIKFTKSGMPSQLQPAGHSAAWRCHESSYFKSSSSFLHTLWTGNREGQLGREKVNFPHFLLDNKHSQIYPAKAASASHKWLTGVNTQDVEFYFWRGCFPGKQLGRAQFCFLLMHLFLPVWCFASPFTSWLSLPAPGRRGQDEEAVIPVTRTVVRQ